MESLFYAFVNDFMDPREPLIYNITSVINEVRGAIYN